jgi:hypothetical protein
MKTQLFKTVFFVTVLFCIHCSDNETPQDQLPPITQTGANTFCAVVDGRIFVPKTSYPSNPGGSIIKGLEVMVGSDFFDNNGDDIWFISTYNSEDTPSTYIYLPTLLNSPSNFIINKSDGSDRFDLPNAHIFCLINQGNSQYLSFENSGELNFSKIDINNGLYSGTFYSKLKNKDDENDVIEITDGRFDINLNTVNN